MGGFDNGDVVLFDLKKGALRWASNVQDGVCSVSVSAGPRAEILACTVASKFHLFDTAAGVHITKKVHSLTPHAVSDLAALLNVMKQCAFVCRTIKAPYGVDGLRRPPPTTCSPQQAAWPQARSISIASMYFSKQKNVHRKKKNQTKKPTALLY